MRVLFVQERLPQEMLGLMWLGRALREAGHKSQLLFLPDPDWSTKLRGFDPEVVLSSVTSGRQSYYAEVHRRIKRKLPDVYSILGGPHPTFFPEVLEQNEHLDAICRGEGEEALVELLAELERGRRPTAIRNFWIRQQHSGEIVKNAQRPLVQELDQLGFPDRELVYEAAPLYRDSERKAFSTQRGCPMSCSFCFHHGMRKKLYGSAYARYVRKRSVDHVLREIEAVRSRYPLRFVHFVDDGFNLSEEWLSEFCERYPREIGLPFDVILMASKTKEWHVEALARAGCAYARVAFESANDYVRNHVLQRETSVQQLRNLSAWIKARGIRLGAFNLLGGPGVSLEEELETLRLNIACKVDHPLVSLMQAEPDLGVAPDSPQLRHAVSAFDDGGERAPEPKRELESLHKLFPIAVRLPFLLPLLPRLIRWRWMAKPYLLAYLLFSEFLIAEQRRAYARAQGQRGPTHWTLIEFVRRTLSKAGLGLWTLCSGRLRGLEALQLQMGDERVVAHVD